MCEFVCGKVYQNVNSRNFIFIHIHSLVYLHKLMLIVSISIDCIWSIVSVKKYEDKRDRNPAHKELKQLENGKNKARGNYILCWDVSLYCLSDLFIIIHIFCPTGSFPWWYRLVLAFLCVPTESVLYWIYQCLFLYESVNFWRVGMYHLQSTVLVKSPLIWMAVP